jgi:hypothetical protein
MARKVQAVQRQTGGGRGFGPTCGFRAMLETELLTPNIPPQLSLLQRGDSEQPSSLQ